MDIYQILIKHNRAWTINEIICFSIIFTFALIVAGYLVKCGRIVISQAIAGLVLILFLGVVFGSTVFTRTPTIRKYKLQLFWSWKAVIINHNWEMLKENLLNCILLLPMGMLLPVVFRNKISWTRAFMYGFFVSAIIETCQLIFRRGLFEWDDMIHNAVGCMVGCIAVSTMIKRYR